jgi:hypothetical protein
MWDGIGKETFRVFRMWLSDERRFDHCGCVSISAAPCDMRPSCNLGRHSAVPSPTLREKQANSGTPTCVWRCQRGQQPGSPGGGAETTQEVCRRRADCARPFASALLSRGTCEMENFSDRANFWQVQCSE